MVTQPLSSYFGIILGPWGTPRPTQTPPRSAKTAPRPPQDGSNKVPDDKPKNETKTKKQLIARKQAKATGPVLKSNRHQTIRYAGCSAWHSRPNSLSNELRRRSSHHPLGLPCQRSSGERHVRTQIHECFNRKQSGSKLETE